MTRISAGILGVGASLPTKIVTNADLEKLVDTSNDWIVTRTGISERRMLEDGQTVSDLAAASARAALKDAGLSAEDIDLVLVASGSPEMIWPSTACLVQAKLAIDGRPAFDLQAACTGFAYGLSVAEQFVASGTYRHALLIGAEAITRHVNWQDRSTCVLFGDGAAAVVLGPVEAGYGLLASYLGADGRGAKLLQIPAGGSGQVASAETVANNLHTITMNGNDIFKFAVRAVPESAERALEQAGLTVRDIDFFIPHQANQRIIEVAAERLGLPEEKVVSNISRYGNTSAASIPLALEEIYRQGRLKKGDIIVSVAFGAGLTWGANVIRWSKE